MRLFAYMHVKLWEINQESAVRFEIYVTHNSHHLHPEELEFCLALPCSPTNTKYSGLVDVNDTLKGNSRAFLTFRRDTVFAWNLDSGSCQILSGMNQTWITFQQRCSHNAVFLAQNTRDFYQIHKIWSWCHRVPKLTPIPIRYQF